MTDRKLFFYSLTLHPSPTSFIAGASCHVQYEKLYFSTERKLELWRKKHPEEEKTAEWAMHEISIKCAKELVKLSKKKVRRRCYECGK